MHELRRQNLLTAGRNRKVESRPEQACAVPAGLLPELRKLVPAYDDDSC
jgi:hypothetical protein